MVLSMAEQMLTVEQVAERLQVHRDTVYAWIRSGQLPGYRIGGRKAGFRIKQSDLERFVEARREQPEE